MNLLADREGLVSHENVFQDHDDIGPDIVHLLPAGVNLPE